ncbi:hypothetical protein CLAIMM_11297 [Cladophialophora immunda]|nr:hypothetical protein CLAIMM_11297 [Cladophialophora immunda]
MAETITISVAEYESLIETGHKFLALKHALLAGGVSTETLDVLTSGDCPQTAPDEEFNSANVRVNEPTQDGAQHVAYSQKPFESGFPSPLTPEYTEEDDAQEEVSGESNEQTGDAITTAKRSLTISGLSPATTLQSLAQVLKGGAILQMYMRPQHGSAHVSFVDPTAAHNFLRYARTNDISIGRKKVKVAWENRQTQMSPSFAKIVQSLGRTRNLVIRFVHPELNEDIIRADLDHIHYLEVVDLFFKKGHAYISLNSIRSAITARSCLMSRLKYKRFQIDFHQDDCAQPLPQKPSATEPVAFSHKNPFQLLFDASEESQEFSNAVDR